ncbi:hypothetical protein BDA96_01G146400 [Sorghum bicolor]|uniref:Uncharacterized protein n=1 Tax=Sorghum bicolor TaxID=4558 RepID=A0A921V046_SORBI|nr:uncharacterized protein LOC8056728 [Sorghum bicolor]KAG0548201.1 hypothetical protein BDA96_01G146400 [Sorghum bicolor]|eukprot:XP_021306794.1 uncharacterized protein LOC8056728 [Sorghum bicolor]
MCYQVKCGTCGKPTWAGCGRHVASVHAQIPEGQHCACRGWPGVAPVEKKAAADDAGKASGGTVASAPAPAEGGAAQ